jgi:hypothetical protein
MQSLFYFKLEQSSQLLRILLITTTLVSLALGHSILATQVLDGYRKEDPVLLKKLPVEADIPEFMFDTGNAPEGSNLNKASGISVSLPTIICCVLENTLLKASMKTQNKLFSLRWRLVSLARTKPATYIASHKMRQIN